MALLKAKMTETSRGDTNKRVGFSPANVRILKQETQRRSKRIGFTPDVVAILKARTQERERERKRREMGIRKRPYIPVKRDAEVYSEADRKRKRIGSPMNEMKKRPYKPLALAKRIGAPMNEMKRSPKVQYNLKELESSIDEAFSLLQRLGVKNAALQSPSRPGLVEVKKRNEASEEDYQWSDYDSWGFDRKRKGLGSIV